MTRTTRGSTLTDAKRAQTKCLKGHVLDGENVRMEGTSRRCRACKDAYDNQRYEADKPKALAQSREWALANPVRAFWNKRRSRLRKKLGIEEADVVALHEKQRGLCPICERTLNLVGINTHIDHDHATGKVRGLLCFPCNILLGNAKDSVANLERAILYLEKSK